MAVLQGVGYAAKNMLRFRVSCRRLIRQGKSQLALCAHEGLKPLGPLGTGVFAWLSCRGVVAVAVLQGVGYAAKNMLRFRVSCRRLIRQGKSQLALCAHEGLKPLGPSGTGLFPWLPACRTLRKPRNCFLQHTRLLAVLHRSYPPV